MVTRYGAAELYGRDLASLSPDQIRALSTVQHREMPCPFKPPDPGSRVRRCSKKGGVCSLRQFSKDDSGRVTASTGPVSTCPHRLLEKNLVVEWVGAVLLGDSQPAVLSELPFLMGDGDGDAEETDAVGMIDQVLVSRQDQHLRWCALEMQAVYFSGGSMENDFKEMRTWNVPGIPFPTVVRRPDFRSSGPKRLMPQLQTKVPTISRWGKKMAVVVDQAFWSSLGAMREVRDLSNAEIAWFVVAFSGPEDGRFHLRRGETHFTTLSHAVEGLTGGTPVSLETFEREIRERMTRNAASSDPCQ